MKHTWKSLFDTPLTLKGPKITLDPQCMHDQCLMDALIDTGTFDDTQLRDLNECRLELEATLISHIATACGNYITQQAWNGKQSVDRKEPHWIHTGKSPHKTSGTLGKMH